MLEANPTKWSLGELELMQMQAQIQSLHLSSSSNRHCNHTNHQHPNPNHRPSTMTLTFSKHATRRKFEHFGGVHERLQNYISHKSFLARCKNAERLNSQNKPSQLYTAKASHIRYPYSVCHTHFRN